MKAWRRLHSTSQIIIIGLGAVVLCLALVFLAARSIPNSPDSQVDYAVYTKQSTDVLDRLPRRAHPTPLTPAIEDANAPLPTNKWFSGLVFGKEPVPVFAYPLSYKATANGYEVGQPVPKATTDIVWAPHAADIVADYGEPVASVVAGHDDLSVRLSHEDAAKTHANSVRLTQGSPFIFGELSPGKTMVFASGLAIIRTDGQTVWLEGNGKRYGIWTDGTLAEGPGTITIGANSTGQASQTKYAVFVLPEGANEEEYIAAAQHQVSHTVVSYEAGGTELRTTYALYTATGQPTIWGRLDLHGGNSERSAGTLLALPGELDFARGNEFSFTQPLARPESSLDVSGFSDADKQLIASQLSADISAPTFDKPDSYYAGKQMYRMAQLLDLADKLGQKEQADTAAAKLGVELGLWLDPSGGATRSSKYFYYDVTIKGIVGVSPAYGSENFNDHYFHYGYMVYAAGILQRYNQSLTADQQAVVQLLVRDIAGESADQYFPKFRHFDAYAGHGWASGYGFFGDGNNQESSSEAALAWAGLYAWAQATGDDRLQETATWLYGRETTAARQLWLNTSGKQYEGYGHPLVSLVWGGKAEYATWFSPEPSAKLAIQLIPLSPAHRYTAADAGDAKEKAGTIPAGNTMFRDYIAMYSAAYDKLAALEAVQKLNNSGFDEANSKAYALAWVLATR